MLINEAVMGKLRQVSAQHSIHRSPFGRFARELVYFALAEKPDKR
jgi:hypothetical protein